MSTLQNFTNDSIEKKSISQFKSFQNTEINKDIKSSTLAKQKFVLSNKEILQKLKNLNLRDKENSESLNYLNKENILNSLKRNISQSSNTPFEIENISKTFSKENLKSTLDENLKSDIKQLSQILEKRIKKISQIVSYQKNCETEFSNVQNEIKIIENELNTVLEKNSEYVTKNQIFLIRNEILQTFVNKMMITKEEKDNLVNKSLIDDLFFKLILKLKQIKFDIAILERNSENFSKTLLFSIKENFQIVEDLMNEKIVLYLKNTFRTKTKFEFGEFKNIFNTVNFLREKENYLNFIIKEFIQMRKKFLEKILRNKYLKINKLDQVFASLIEDFEFHFLKEFVILFNLFNIEKEIFSYEEQNEIFSLLNCDSETCSESVSKNVEKLISIIVKRNFGYNGEKANPKSQNKNDHNIQNLNTILYVLEELFYENVNLKNSSSIQNSSPQSQTNSQLQFQFFSQSSQIKANLSEIYKITILSTYYHTKIEKLLTVNLKFPPNTLYDNLNLFSMINNYKKSFSNIFSKILNECHKNLIKLQSSFRNMKEDSFNENNLNRNLLNLAEEFSKCFECYEKFSPLLKEEDKENLHPKNNNTFKLLINFFNQENYLNPNQSQISLPNLLKAFNLVEIFFSKLESFEKNCNIKSEIEILENCLISMENTIVNNFVEVIMKSTKFEENLRINLNSDNVMGLMENLLEKFQFYFMNLNLVHDFNTKENLKEKIKKGIIRIYKEVIESESVSQLKMNSNVFTEEEFSNYLELL